MLTLRIQNGTKGMDNHPSTAYRIDGYCLEALSIFITIQRMVSAV